MALAEKMGMASPDHRPQGLMTPTRPEHAFNRRKAVFYLSELDNASGFAAPMHRTAIFRDNRDGVPCMRANSTELPRLNRPSSYA
jgi:hypothetical protein